jgi:hypothetical protein
MNRRSGGAVGGRTLIFCTGYLADAGVWAARYRPWCEHVAGLAIGHDAVFIFDDASPCLPDEGEVAIHAALPDTPDSRPNFLRFAEHLGRPSNVQFPGWVRSFFHSVVVARRYGFDKIVHLEADARILSARMAAHVEALDTGWSAFWCPAYNMPETAIQVICADSFDLMEEFARDPVAAQDGQMLELALPFTHIDMSMKGDRYGEVGAFIPPDADYVCQFEFFKSAPADLQLTRGAAMVPADAKRGADSPWRRMLERILGS